MEYYESKRNGMAIIIRTWLDGQKRTGGSLSVRHSLHGAAVIFAGCWRSSKGAKPRLYSFPILLPALDCLSGPL